MTWFSVILWAVVVIAADAGFSGFLTIGSLRPSLTLPFVVYIGLRSGSITAAIIGFLAGFAMDSLSGGVMGTSSFSFVMCGFFSGKFWQGGAFRLHWPWGMFVLVCALFYEAVAHLVLARTAGISFFGLYFTEGIPSAIYTTLLAALWFLSPLHRERKS